MTFIEKELNAADSSITPPINIQIQQIWIILSNGTCPVHIYFKGKKLESHLFAAFATALFSFSKDISNTDIQYMSFEELNIYYLSSKGANYFTAIAADQGSNPIRIQKYLQVISSRFSQFYSTYIEQLSSSAPLDLAYFQKSIEKYIQYSENFAQIDIFSKTPPFSLNSLILNAKIFDNFIGILCEDEILRLFNYSTFEFLNVYYSELGKIKIWSIYPSKNYIFIIEDGKPPTLIVNPITASEDKQSIKCQIPLADVTWIAAHSSKSEVIFGSVNEYCRITVDSLHILNDAPMKLPFNVKQAVFHPKMSLLIFITLEGTVYVAEDWANPNNVQSVPFLKPVNDMFLGIEETIFFQHSDGTVSLSNLTSPPLILKTKISHLVSAWNNLEEKVTYLITIEEDMYILKILNELGDLLVSYSLPSQIVIAAGLTHPQIREKRFLLIDRDGSAKIFDAVIERKRVQDNKLIFDRKLASANEKMKRIFKNIEELLESIGNTNVGSHIVENEITQSKVLRQQLKSVISPDFINKVGIPIYIQEQIRSINKQILDLNTMLDELDLALIKKHTKARSNEMSTIPPKERILHFIAKLKPRQSIPVADIAQELQLEYNVCLNILLELDQEKFLPGTIREITKTGFLEQNALFIKEDPEFDKLSKSFSF